MRGLHHREPGALGALLLAQNVSAELIADGIHVHPAMIRLAWQIKGAERLVLVTDAMRAKCLGDGCYDLGGQVVHVSKGEARLADDILAGSTLTMEAAIQNMQQFTGCSFVEAVQMATATPAKILGIFHERGSITQGKIADLVALNAYGAVQSTMVSGRWVFSL